MSTDLWIILIFFTTLLFVASFFLKKALSVYSDMNGIRDFFLFKNTLSQHEVSSSIYASGMSLATVFIAFLQLAGYLKGVLLLATVFYIIGWVFLIPFIPKIKSYNQDFTLHTFLAERFSSTKIRILTSLVTSIGFIGIASTELIVGTEIMNHLNIVNFNTYNLGLFLIGFLVVLYTIIGGFKAVTDTDIYQKFLIIWTIFLLFSFSIYLLYGSSEEKGVNILTTLSDMIDFENASIIVIVNLLLINVFFPIVDMSAWQRIIASKSSRIAINGVFVAIKTFFISWLTILFIALVFSHFYNTSEADGGYLEIIKSIFTLFNSSDGSFILGLSIVAILFAGLLSAMLSTADSFLIASSQTIIKDILNKKDQLLTVSKARLVTFFIGIGGIISAFILYSSGFKVVELVFSVYGGTLALFPVVIVALISKRDLTKYSSIALISVSFGFILSWLNGFYSVLYSSENSFAIAIHNIFDFYSPSAYNSPSIAITVSSSIFFTYYVLIKNKKGK